MLKRFVWGTMMFACGIFGMATIFNFYPNSGFERFAVVLLVAYTLGFCLAYILEKVLEEVLGG